jgi:hypothetical protein
MDISAHGTLQTGKNGTWYNAQLHTVKKGYVTYTIILIKDTLPSLVAQQVDTQWIYLSMEHCKRPRMVHGTMLSRNRSVTGSRNKKGS